MPPLMLPLVPAHSHMSARSLRDNGLDANAKDQLTKAARQGLTLKL